MTCDALRFGQCAGMCGTMGMHDAGLQGCRDAGHTRRAGTRSRDSVCFFTMLLGDVVRFTLMYLLFHSQPRTCFPAGAGQTLGGIRVVRVRSLTSERLINFRHVYADVVTRPISPLDPASDLRLARRLAKAVHGSMMSSTHPVLNCRQPRGTRPRHFVTTLSLSCITTPSRSRRTPRYAPSRAATRTAP